MGKEQAVWPFPAWPRVGGHVNLVPEKTAKKNVAILILSSPTKHEFSPFQMRLRLVASTAVLHVLQHVCCELVLRFQWPGQCPGSARFGEHKTLYIDDCGVFYGPASARLVLVLADTENAMLYIDDCAFCDVAFR